MTDLQRLLYRIRDEGFIPPYEERISLVWCGLLEAQRWVNGRPCVELAPDGLALLADIRDAERWRALEAHLSKCQWGQLVLKTFPEFADLAGMAQAFLDQDALLAAQGNTPPAQEGP